MFIDILLFILGVALLTFGASLLIKGSATLSIICGISPLVVGLTVVAFGTSSPEWMVSVVASLRNQSDVAVGNVVGSNIFNILFILGGSALIFPVRVHKELIYRDIPVMIIVAFLAWIFSIRGVIGQLEGAIFLIFLIAYTFYTVKKGAKPEEVETLHYRSKWTAGFFSLMFIILGLIMLVKGSEILVESSISIARTLGISELVIALTIVAAGTSMPEVATSFMAAWKRHPDIAIGNIVGSNIFNILAVLGSAAVVSEKGLTVSNATIYGDMPFMCAVSLLCFIYCYTGRIVTRIEGGILMLAYVSYTIYLLYR